MTNALVFRPVNWQPTLCLNRTFLMASFEVANTGAHFSSFSIFSWDLERCVVTHPDVGSFGREVGLDLLSHLAHLDLLEQSPAVRMDREKIESVRLARLLTARVAEMPGSRLLRTAAELRSRFLMAIDRGEPLPANEVRRMPAEAPGCLTALGDALPTAETVDLLRRHAPVIEVGAGPGLWARTLAQAGIDGLATDIGTSRQVGRWGNVLRGWHARRALAASFARGRSILILWPTFSRDGWASDTVNALKQGAVLLIGSPELDFVRDVDRLHGRHGGPETAPMREARRIIQMLDEHFEPLADAPLASAAPDRLNVRLRAYRRLH